MCAKIARKNELCEKHSYIFAKNYSCVINLFVYLHGITLIADVNLKN